MNAKAGQKCVLQIPYQEGLKIKVNGKAVSYDKVFGDLVSFDLQEGELPNLKCYPMDTEKYLEEHK